MAFCRMNKTKTLMLGKTVPTTFGLLILLYLQLRIVSDLERRMNKANIDLLVIFLSLN